MKAQGQGRMPFVPVAFVCKAVMAVILLAVHIKL